MANLNRLDVQTRSRIYDFCMERGKPPSIAELSAAMDAPVEQLRGALANLAEAHMLVLQKDSGEILMANPFSAVPTPFVVETASFSCYANCIWDSLGVAAMLHQDVSIRTSCADCGQALALQVFDEQVSSAAGLIHFAVPARHWWDDIVFT